MDSLLFVLVWNWYQNKFLINLFPTPFRVSFSPLHSFCVSFPLFLISFSFPYPQPLLIPFTYPSLNLFHVSLPPQISFISKQFFQLICFPPFRVTVPPSLTSLSHFPPFLIIVTFLSLNLFLSLSYICISISFTPPIYFTFPSLILSHFPPTLD